MARKRAGAPARPRNRVRRPLAPEGAQARRTPPAKRPSAVPPPAPSDAGFLRETPASQPTIVAVGASAGGLDAFSAILERLPQPSNLAVVFVQHLSPQHESALPELLAAKTSMWVGQAVNGMSLEMDHVYVIPPNARLEVLDGRLHLLPRPTDRTQYTPIDFFFTSVARWGRERVIGVILSGTASDGAAGIREIKACGGITIAQSPESARHDGMPRAAIETGMVDLILSPQGIAEQVAQVRLHPYLLPPAAAVPGTEPLAVTDAQLRDIFVLLRRASGIDFEQYKTPTIKRRLLRRMAVVRLVDVDAYLRYLAEHEAEATALSQDLLIHVTRFFRDTESFEGLRAIVFPQIVERHEPDIRIWVPGCASGEEAYSVAICLLESLGDRAAERRIQVFATDVSETSIEQARTGIYPLSISADVSPERLSRFFSKVDGGYRIAKLIREMCVFAKHDLTRDPPFSRLSLIVCRNVLIYLDMALQKRLMAMFHYALTFNGFLMLGTSETIGPSAYFAPIDKKWRIFRKLPVDVRLPVTAGRVVSRDRPRRPAALAPLESRSIQEEANRLVLDRYAPPGVIVDADLHIVQFRGRTGPYLEPAAGEPNLSVLKMARSGLFHGLQSSLRLARQKSRVVRKDDLRVQHDGGWRRFSLEVVPLVSPRGEHFLILFKDAPAAARPGKLKGAGRTRGRGTGGQASQKRLGDMGRELVANRDYLQSVIQELEGANEELQSANEEILSSNEELQSTNEELDTAKEELQSVNEELNTVNEELRFRNEELGHANSDLLNLLGSVDFPIVMVDNDLAIRRYTPKAEQMFNLIATDIGRPIGQIKPNFDASNLETLIRETIENVEPREREILDNEGHWQLLRIRPYRTLDKRLSGAVLAMVNIDGTRRYQTHLEQARDSFRAVFETVRQALVLMDAGLHVLAANRAFYETFRLTPEEIERRPMVDLAGGRWNVPELHDMLGRVLAGGGSAERTIEPDLPGFGRRRLITRAQPLELEDHTRGVLMVVEDAPEAAPR